MTLVHIPLNEGDRASGRDDHLDAPKPLERGDHAVARRAGLGVAPMPKGRPVRPASAANTGMGTGMGMGMGMGMENGHGHGGALSWGRLRRDLALRGASGEAAGRGPRYRET